MHCEQNLINVLCLDNYSLINEMADIYNAERLKEYCNWFYRRHCYSIECEVSANDDQMID
jgi:hypothetical protein